MRQLVEPEARSSVRKASLLPISVAIAALTEFGRQDGTAAILKAMPPAELALVNKILASIYGDVEPIYVAGLLRTRTWATVYDQVRREKQG